MFSALQQGGKRLYDLARQGQVVERAARPVRVHDLELLRTRRDWQRAAVSKRHPCHLQHPQISHKDSTATTASALASAARAESPGWSEVLQLSPVICSAARAAGVRDETPPISPHAFPAQLRRRSETEGASVPGEDAAAAAVLGDDSGSGGDEDCIELPCFALDVECGGGTYVRSLISDIVSVGQTLRRPDRRVPADTASACLNCCLFVCVKKNFWGGFIPRLTIHSRPSTRSWDRRRTWSGSSARARAPLASKIAYRSRSGPTSRSASTLRAARALWKA